MNKEYKVSIVARGEGLDYSDSQGTYSFNVARVKKKWIVYLPPSLNGMPHELIGEESERVQSRICEHLCRKKSFGFFGGKRAVSFESSQPFDMESYLKEQQAAGWKVVRNPDGSTTAFPPPAKGIVARLIRAVFS